MSGRAASVLFILLGALVSGLTAAVQAGLVTGVRAAWPAHVIAGVLVVVGLVNLRRADAPEQREERGPIRESGRDPEDVELPGGRMRRLGPMERDEQTLRDGGGGEPNGRD